MCIVVAVIRDKAGHQLFPQRFDRRIGDADGDPAIALLNRDIEGADDDQLLGLPEAGKLRVGFVPPRTDFEAAERFPSDAELLQCRVDHAPHRFQLEGGEIAVAVDRKAAAAAESALDQRDDQRRFDHQHDHSAQRAHREQRQIGRAAETFHQVPVLDELNSRRGDRHAAPQMLQQRTAQIAPEAVVDALQRRLEIG